MFEIYKDMNVLITGVTGFKGSWLAEYLLMLGANVYGYANERKQHYIDLKLNEKLDGSWLDDINSTHLLPIMKEIKPDIIFHLAAQPLVINSYNDPVTTYKTNILGTINLYECCKQLESPPVIVTITTDKVYYNKEWIYGYREEDILGGADPYSCSKACVELITESYKQSFFEKHNILVATCRAGNVLGGGDWGKHRLVPDLIRAFQKEEKFVLRNPNSTRPWNYILDVLTGYLQVGKELLRDKREFQGSWNFGPESNSTISTKVLIDKCLNYFPQYTDIVSFDTEGIPKFHETEVLKLDSSKSKSLLKWKPIYNIDATILSTMEWYDNYIQNDKIITTNQIERYFNHLINLQGDI